MGVPLVLPSNRTTILLVGRRRKKRKVQFFLHVGLIFPVFFCGDNPGLLLPYHDLGDSDFRSWIRYAQRKTLWGGEETRSQHLFFQLVQLGYGVMVFLWSNKVWILLAQLLRLSRGKDKCQNCLVARWLSWERHELLKAGNTAWPNGLSAGDGWGLGQKLPLVEFLKKPGCCRWILPQPNSAGIRHGHRSLLKRSC